MISRGKRILLITVGLLALGLAGIGVFVPLLPTTPFVLVAAFAFANSSDKLHQWLIDHNVFGAIIANWRQYGAISSSAKAVSILSMIAILVLSWWLGVEAWIIVAQAIVLSCSAAFVLSRPLPPKD